ncbi:MAG: alpha-L-rhamnosidase [Chlamydiae bacterium]|nr:MAG: alpha-L-rhamnosidase [Chlamydiota bacterium]
MQIKNLKTEYKINPIGIDVIVPRLSWQIVSNEKNVMQTAYRIHTADSLENLNAEKLIWDSGKISSDNPEHPEQLNSINIKYGGPKPKSSQRFYWKVCVWTNKNNSSWSEPAFWEMGLLEITDWKADWIHPLIDEDISKACLCPILRKEFNLNKRINSARVYASALGLYELKINGQHISKNLFTPGWTSYNKRIQYQTYDITDLLKKGANAVGATLGDGWFRGHLAGWIKDNRNFYGEKLALLMQINVGYEDGTTETIVTDSSWKSSTGPILSSDIYNGEIYDARLEKDGWCNVNFDDSDWNKVETLNHSKDILIAQTGPPVKRIQEVKAIEIIKTPKGETVFDFGQNMVGWIKFKVKGKPGDKVVLRHAEILDPEGNFYIANLKGAKQTIEYTLQSNEEEVFEPHFTFQGFRYVAVDEFPGEPILENFVGIVVHSDMEVTGSFECSNSLVNKLQQNILWGQKDNFLDVPTDCPQRSERLGWTGDAQVFAATASFNMDVSSFFTKWLGDLKADQLDNGSVVHIVPYIPVLGEGGAGGAAWADSAVIVPWVIYQTYDDVRLLENQYRSMKSWVDFMKKEAGSSYLYTSGFHYGDWLAFTTDRSDYPGATTCKELISSAFFAYSTSLLIKVAEVLNKKNDIKIYEKLYDNIKNAFQNEFITPNGRVTSNTQTAYLLALAFDLVPENLKKNTAKKLADDVRKFGHITTGFVGTPFICHVLTKFGYNDLAYMLLNRIEYPSWLYPITKGATTIWERWDGIKPDGSINTKAAFSIDEDEMMNSFNHYAYGAIGDWMYKTIAGIKQDETSSGYKKIIIQPQPGGGLSFAKAEFKSIYGKISSDWKIENKKFVLEVEIPPNTTAKVFVPDSNQESGFKKHNIGSGKYKFESIL